jgi:hypothetical protein
MRKTYISFELTEGTKSEELVQKILQIEDADIIKKIEICENDMVSTIE